MIKGALSASCKTRRLTSACFTVLTDTQRNLTEIVHIPLIVKFVFMNHINSSERNRSTFLTRRTEERSFMTNALFMTQGNEIKVCSS